MTYDGILWLANSPLTKSCSNDDRNLYSLFILEILVRFEQDVFVKDIMPPKYPSFEKHDPDICH